MGRWITTRAGDHAKSVKSTVLCLYSFSHFSDTRHTRIIVVGANLTIIVEMIAWFKFCFDLLLLVPWTSCRQRSRRRCCCCCCSRWCRRCPSCLSRPCKVVASTGGAVAAAGIAFYIIESHFQALYSPSEGNFPSDACNGYALLFTVASQLFKKPDKNVGSQFYTSNRE